MCLCVCVCVCGLSSRVLLQRGKGMFYLGVGLLVFFMAPDSLEKSMAGSWGINNVAALVIAIAFVWQEVHKRPVLQGA